MNYERAPEHRNLCIIAFALLHNETNNCENKQHLELLSKVTFKHWQRSERHESTESGVTLEFGNDYEHRRAGRLVRPHYLLANLLHMGQTQTRRGPEVFDLWHPAVDAHGAWAFGLIKHSKYSTTDSKTN
jgi:hypothetical protein